MSNIIPATDYLLVLVSDDRLTDVAARTNYYTSGVVNAVGSAISKDSELIGTKVYFSPIPMDEAICPTPSEKFVLVPIDSVKGWDEA